MNVYFYVFQQVCKVYFIRIISLFFSHFCTYSYFHSVYVSLLDGVPQLLGSFHFSPILFLLFLRLDHLCCPIFTFAAKICLSIPLLNLLFQLLCFQLKIFFCSFLKVSYLYIYISICSHITIITSSTSCLSSSNIFKRVILKPLSFISTICSFSWMVSVGSVGL